MMPRGEREDLYFSARIYVSKQKARDLCVCLRSQGVVCMLLLDAAARVPSHQKPVNVFVHTRSDVP